MDDSTQSFFPLVALERISQPLLRLLAFLLMVASLWGIVNQLTVWSRPVKLAVGTAGQVQQERHSGHVRYRLPLALETGEEMSLWLSNHSPVLDYFLSNTPAAPIAVRYWSDDMRVVAVHPLAAGVPPIRAHIPPSSVLLGTSVLGLLLALVILGSGLSWASGGAGRG